MKKTILFSCITATLLQATTLTGFGYGETKESSKKEALADLSNQISVDVKSNSKNYTSVLGGEYKKNSEKLIELSSNLPLKGVEFTLDETKEQIETKALITSKNAMSAYKMELQRLKQNIASSELSLKTTKDTTQKYQLLKIILDDIQNFNRYKIVAVMLGGENLPTLDINENELKIELQALEKKVSSIELAGEILTANITQKNIYISAIKPSGSNEITQFAKILKNNMEKHLGFTQKSDEAEYFLFGNYEIIKDSLFITIYLSDKENNILKTNTITLEESGYKNIAYKPTTKTFDKSLNDGFVKSGELSVQIGFKGYDRANGIDLRGGESVDVVAKTNKAMCYFLVGHTLKKGETFSYLLPIGSDNTPFINSITGDDVNRFVTIVDKVPVEEPFGSENLQIFASTFEANGKCPLVVPKTQEDKNGYFVIDGKPEQVVAKTRGLNLKKKDVKIEKSESSVSFTSFGK